MNEKQFIMVPNKITRNLQSSLGAPAQRLKGMLNYCVDLYARDGETWTVPIPLLLQLVAGGKKRYSGSHMIQLVRIHKELMKYIQTFHNHEANRTHLFPILQTVTINHNENSFTYTLHPLAKFAMTKIKDDFTRVALIATLGAKSGYTLRFYELLRSYMSMGKILITVSKLRDITDTQEKYIDWRHWRERVLRVAIDEINNYSDIHVTCESIHEETSRLITKIQFTITPVAEPDSENHRLYSELLTRIRLEGETRNTDGVRQSLEFVSRFPKRIKS